MTWGGIGGEVKDEVGKGRWDRRLRAGKRWERNGGRKLYKREYGWKNKGGRRWTGWNVGEDVL